MSKPSAAASSHPSAKPRRVEAAGVVAQVVAGVVVAEILQPLGDDPRVLGEQDGGVFRRAGQAVDGGEVEQGQGPLGGGVGVPGPAVRPATEPLGPGPPQNHHPGRIDRGLLQRHPGETMQAELGFQVHSGQGLGREQGLRRGGIDGEPVAVQPEPQRRVRPGLRRFGERPGGGGERRQGEGGAGRVMGGIGGLARRAAGQPQPQPAAEHRIVPELPGLADQRADHQRDTSTGASARSTGWRENEREATATLVMKHSGGRGSRVRVSGKVDRSSITASAPSSASGT